MNSKAQLSVEILVSMLLLFAVFSVAIFDSVLKNNLTKAIEISMGNDNTCMQLSSIVSKISLNQGMQTSIILEKNARVFSNQIISVQDQNQLNICSHSGRVNDANLSKGSVLIKNVTGVVEFVQAG